MMLTCTFLKLGFQKKFNVSRREGNADFFCLSGVKLDARLSLKAFTDAQS